MLALLGLRLSIAASKQARSDAQRLGKLANLTVEGIGVLAEGRITSIASSLEKQSRHSRGNIEGQPLTVLFADTDVDNLSLLKEQEGFAAGQ